MSSRAAIPAACSIRLSLAQLILALLVGFNPSFDVVNDAGFKGGFAFGATDDFGYKAVENVVTVHDLHATLLSALGIEHQRLAYPHDGRDTSLTDPEVTGAQVVTQLLA